MSHQNITIETDKIAADYKVVIKHCPNGDLEISQKHKSLEEQIEEDQTTHYSFRPFLYLLVLAILVAALFAPPFDKQEPLVNSKGTTENTQNH